MARQPTDYNDPPPGRFVRTAKWLYAPENVTTKARKRSRNFLIVLGLVLAAGLAVIWIRPTSTPVTDTVGVAAPTVPPLLITSECAPADAVEYPPEQVILGAYEPIWVRDGGMSRPTSPAGGPFSGDPYPRCFSRTPEGALYAATSFATGVLAATDSGDLKPFFDVRASHSGNYTAMVSDLPELVPDTDRPQTEITGYRWNSYTPERVSLEIKFTAVTGPAAGESIASLYTLTWENNDWLMIVPGSSDTTQVPIQDNKTYIPWGSA